MYLFTAYDEGANAFRYNPAVLGLGHRLNAAVNMFIKNHIDNKADIDEFDLLINAGSFGFSYRIASLNKNYSMLTPAHNNYMQTYSLGFGLGNKTFSAGFIVEWQSMEKLYLSTTDFESERTRFRGSIGFLYRPSKFLSTALTLKTKEILNGSIGASQKVTIGAAVRPLVKDLLTLMCDFSFTPYNNYGYFENHQLKIGVDVKPANGFHLFGSFTRINSVSIDDYLNFGIRFDLPNFSARYTNSFNKFTDRDNSFTSYKTAGHHVSLSYNLEKRESLVKEPKRLLELTLSGSLQDYNTDDILFGVLGKGKRSIHEVIADIDYASTDESIKGLLVKIYPLSTGRFEISAQLEELGGAMERFRDRGKKITAYLPEGAGPAEYYTATFADDIVMPEEGLLFYGLSIEVINYRQFLQKYGIELQTLYAGKYKLTFQGLIDSTTEEGKEVINRMLDIIYDKMLYRVVSARNITLDDYMRTKLSQPMTGREAKRLGLIDNLGWYEDAKETAKKNSKTSLLAGSLNRNLWDDQWSEPGRIAIIGVYGSITEGESEAPSPFSLPIPFLSGGRTTGSETVVEQLEEAFSDPKVKAVILRVNSGGGSALASSEINEAAARLRKKYGKPFIVSMGGAAASGGYLVSIGADKIFCDELTVTGSIGVFGAIPNVDSLVSQQKIKVEIFKRGENSDIGSMFKKLDPREIEIIQGIIDFYYDRFVTEVAKRRKLTREEAEQIAQGRVWLGTDAFNKRLVDEIGGLYETIKYAKKKSKLGNRFKIVYYAVPGGETIDQLVTSSVMKYFQKSLLELLGFDEEKNIEIIY